MDRDELLRLLREDPEVQGAILFLLAGALHGAPQPTERRRPAWVEKVLAESDAANGRVPS